MIFSQETGSTDVLYMQLDLASLRSVRCFTEVFLKTESRLDLLINNAGTQTHTRRYMKTNDLWYDILKSETTV